MLDSRFWDKYFKVYDTLNLLIPYQDLLNAICEELDVQKGSKVLDVGSGTGNLSLKIKALGGQITGVDISKEGIAVHQRKDPSATIILHDISEPLPFPDNSFDRVCSNNTLYAISSGKRGNVFRELYRVLKPSGVIVIANIRKGFSPLKIYLTHVKIDIKEKGIISALKRLLRLFIPTIKIFYYNMLIKRENVHGGFDFFNDNEQKEFLAQSGFVNISETKILYAKQAVLNKASKK